MPHDARRRVIVSVARARCFSWLLVIVASISLPALAVGPLEIDLRADNVIGDGYNSNTHGYEAEFIRRTLTQVTHRKVIADVCSFAETVSVEVETWDEAKPCEAQTQSFRALPQGVSSVVVTLLARPRVPHGQPVQMERFTVATELFKGYGNCVPKAHPRPRRITKCDHSFSVPLPPANNQGIPGHTIKAEAFGNTGIVQTASKSVMVPRRVPLIVSVGDSYASGEGVPDEKGASLAGSGFLKNCKEDTTAMLRNGTLPEMGRNPVWYDRVDHKSLKSGPALAAKRIQKDWPYTVFLTFAKSGATVQDVVGQLQRARNTLGNHRIDVLLVAAGVNDVGFEPTLELFTKENLGGDREAVLTKFGTKLETLRTIKYPDLSAELAGLNVGQVLVTEYSGMLFNNSAGEPDKGCEVFEDVTTGYFSITAKEASYLNEMGALLNDEIQRLVDLRNSQLRSQGKSPIWRRVTGLSDAFERNGYCAQEKYYRWAEDSCDQQGDFRGTLHPNEAGSDAISRILEQELRLVMPDFHSQPVFK